MRSPWSLNNRKENENEDRKRKRTWEELKERSTVSYRHQGMREGLFSPLQLCQAVWDAGPERRYSLAETLGEPLDNASTHSPGEIESKSSKSEINLNSVLLPFILSLKSGVCFTVRTHYSLNITFLLEILGLYLDSIKFATFSWKSKFTCPRLFQAYQVFPVM